MNRKYLALLALLEIVVYRVVGSSGHNLGKNMDYYS
jgi:hypothetical protein